MNGATRYRNILVALDLEHDTQVKQLLSVLRELIEHKGCAVHLVTVVPAGPALVSQFLERDYEHLASREAEASLGALAKTLADSEHTVSYEVRFGHIYEEVLAAATNHDTDLILVGAHKPDFGDFLLGSNAARILRHANCSVFVVRS